MTNKIDYFETCVSNNRNNKGIIKVSDGGRMELKGRGTMTWKLEDDDGVVHKVKIRYTLYVTKLDCCLLSLQHIDQGLEKESGTIYTNQHGSNCAFVMPRFTKAIPNNVRANVPTMHLTPG